MRIGPFIVTILNFFLYALFARVIIDYIRMFSRTWRPRGFVLYLVEAVYSITDPPMRFVGRFVPPLRLGGIAIDLSFIVLFMVVRFASVLIYNI